jgi:hypothetical protein
MPFPRWLASFFFDPEFDAQMERRDHLEDLRRLERIASGRSAPSPTPAPAKNPRATERAARRALKAR